MSVVFVLTSIFSLCTLRGYGIGERITVFSQGAGHPELLQMVWIFVLAGAFASAAREMGAVSATVDLALWCLPDFMLLPGFFFAACVVSLCIGTSVGTVVALVPMALELAARTGTGTPLMVAAVVGGAFFGDNLSFISDTTVAATRTQGCSMRDKFRTNFRIVLPAAMLCLVIYMLIGAQQAVGGFREPAAGLHVWRIMPYAAVLVLALMGVNVLMVLCVGILLAGIVGMAEGAFGWQGWLSSMAAGIAGMGELILVSMMAGGLLAVVRKGGGVTWLVRGLTRRVRTRRGAEFGMALLVSATNLCTANNTVAILSVGVIVRDISARFGVDRRRAASLLDIFSCVVQGVIPYGAQLLMAGGLAGISPVEIVPYLYYPMILGGVTLLGIAFGREERGGHGGASRNVPT